MYLQVNVILVFVYQVIYQSLRSLAPLFLGQKLFTGEKKDKYVFGAGVFVEKWL